MLKRGEIYIRPEGFVPDGFMVSPESEFYASWQDDDEDADIEDAVFDNAEEAIAWGRARSDVVLIRLGSTGDTYFSAGSVLVSDDEGPLPPWPPDVPSRGWWTAGSDPEGRADAAWENDQPRSWSNEPEIRGWAEPDEHAATDDGD